MISEENRHNAIVFGGSGLLGRYVVQFLINRGHNVVCVDLVEFPSDFISEKDKKKLKQVILDVTDELKLSEFLLSENFDVVYWLISKIDLNPVPCSESTWRINVTSLGSALDLCIETLQTRNTKETKFSDCAFVFVSSTDVTSNQNDEELDCDEKFLSEEEFDDSYTLTKIVGEKIVKKAHLSGEKKFNSKLRTIILRPSILYGPNDLLVQSVVNVNVFPRVLQRKKQKYEFVSLWNAAHSVVLAGEKLLVDQTCGGQSYVITEDYRPDYCDHIDTIRQDVLPPCKRIYLPAFLLLFIGWITEWLMYLMKNYFPSTKIDLPSRIVLNKFTKSFSTNHNKATKILGYSPIKTTEDGLKETREWFTKYYKEQNKKQKFNL
eukprot:c15626_g1_i1.p1 GENE.c15626_g1_i1~~c15626_g1_i1.p1  ORF type:complete len:378 (-),score=130.15 c15626_g1_i1:7-1140(-)